MSEVDVAIVGAGVVGLAIARHFSSIGMSVVVIEKEKMFGAGISSRNSEVVHAGLYYDMNSLKSKLCIRGKSLIYEYCLKKRIPAKKLGKLIVANSEDKLFQLERIKLSATNNGVSDLRIIDCEEATKLESEINCKYALYSPSTGVVDSHQLMLSFLVDAEKSGVLIAYANEVSQIVPSNKNLKVFIKGSDAVAVTAKYVINASGLNSTLVARSTLGINTQSIPEMRFAKGDYFSYSAPPPFSRLVYPLPNKHGLGIHYTMDLNGGVRFGPDVEWVNDVNYSPDPLKIDIYYETIKEYWPKVKKEKLMPSYSGIRPKIFFENNIHTDFLISTSANHGVDNLINLYGIESPGLTSSMAIAEYLESLI